MLEREFQKRFKAYLEKNECVVYKNPAGLMGGNRGMSYSVASGFPDLVVYNKGNTTLVELKTDSKTSKLRTSQVKRFKQLNGVGINVYVMRPKDFTDDFIANFIAYGFDKAAFNCLRKWDEDAKQFGVGK